MKSVNKVDMSATIQPPHHNRYSFGPQLVQGHTFTVSNRYNLSETGKILGKGSFGLVSSCVDTKTGAKIAVKRIRPYANDDWDARHTLREVRLMRLLDPHPNIISLYDVSLWDKKTELYMMMELMDCDLHKVIQSKQPLSDNHFKCFIKQLLEGVKTMHAMDIFHRDLKPGNILVSRDCQLRITDFGLARYMHSETLIGQNEQNPMTEYVVTRWYRAPELLLAPSKPYGSSIDLWSVGCILAELILRGPLFPGKSHAQQVSLVFEVLGFQGDDVGFPLTAEALTFLKKRCTGAGKGLPACIPGASPEALSLISSLLAVKPAQRPSAVEALQHTYLSDAECLYKYPEIDSYIQSTIISKGKVNAQFFDFERDYYTTEALVSLIRREVGEHSQDLVQTREEQSPGQDSQGRPGGEQSTAPKGAESDPNSATPSRASTAEARSQPLDRVNTAQASHTRAADDGGMEVESSQEEQVQEQVTTVNGDPMDVQGEAIEELQRSSAISANANGQSMSPHRMGSIVRKSNKARAMQRMEDANGGAVSEATVAKKGLGGMLITRSVLNKDGNTGTNERDAIRNLRSSARKPKPEIVGDKSTNVTDKSRPQLKSAYNNGILRSLQDQAHSLVRSSRSAGGIAGSGPAAKRPVHASNRGNSAAAKLAAAAAAAGGRVSRLNGTSSNPVIGDSTLQRPKAAPAGRSALLPRLKQN